MALHDPSLKLTYEDYLLIPDDGKRHEIIDGEHYVTATPFLRHQRIVRRLTVRLDGFLREHHLGEVLIAPTDVILSPHDIVQPDLLFISNERAAPSLRTVRGAGVLDPRSTPQDHSGLGTDGRRSTAQGPALRSRGRCPHDSLAAGSRDAVGRDLRRIVGGVSPPNNRRGSSRLRSPAGSDGPLVAGFRPAPKGQDLNSPTRKRRVRGTHTSKSPEGPTSSCALPQCYDSRKRRL